MPPFNVPSIYNAGGSTETSGDVGNQKERGRTRERIDYQQQPDDLGGYRSRDAKSEGRRGRDPTSRRPSEDLPYLQQQEDDYSRVSMI